MLPGGTLLVQRPSCHLKQHQHQLQHQETSTSISCNISRPAPASATTSVDQHQHQLQHRDTRRRGLCRSHATLVELRKRSYASEKNIYIDDSSLGFRLLAWLRVHKVVVRFTNGSCYLFELSYQLTELHSIHACQFLGEVLHQAAAQHFAPFVPSKPSN